MQSIVISVYVCLLFVCLFVRSHISKNTRSNFLYMLTRGVGRSVLLWQQCSMLCTSGFVDVVMFPYNGGNGPEPKTTRIYVSFSSPGGGTSLTSDNVVLSRSPGGCTRGEVCRLRLHLVGCERHLLLTGQCYSTRREYNSSVIDQFITVLSSSVHQCEFVSQRPVLQCPVL